MRMDLRFMLPPDPIASKRMRGRFRYRKRYLRRQLTRK
jgi:hypothetical protein